MGMYDEVICKAKLPGDPPAFVLKPGYRFQTKDLDCLFDTYEIGEYLTKDGVAVKDVGSLNFEKTSCAMCGNLATCTCALSARHEPNCRFLIAAKLSIELACEHGCQACPVCDPCTCKVPIQEQPVL